MSSGCSTPAKRKKTGMSSGFSTSAKREKTVSWKTLLSGVNPPDGVDLEQILGSQIDADIFLQNPVCVQEYILRGFLGETFDLIPLIIESIQQNMHFNRPLQVLLVREEELQAAKKDFLSVMTVHVYSVQKTRIEDSSTLFLADYDICKEHISSYSRWSCPQPNPLPSSTQPAPASLAREMARENKFPELQLKNGKKEQREKKGDAKVVTEKKQNIESSKSKAAESAPRKPTKKSSESKMKEVSRSNVATFFNKPGAVKTVAEKQSEKVAAKASVKKSAGGFLNDSDIDGGSDSGGEFLVPAAPKPKTSMKVATKKGVPDTSAKAPSQQRKRKRVQNIMSSDEESMKTSGMATGFASGGKRRKRVKRLKSRMYTTEDGAMVTEKVRESESTDSSQPVTKPHNNKGGRNKAPGVKTSPPKAKKQTLLSSFFKKSN